MRRRGKIHWGAVTEIVFFVLSAKCQFAFFSKSPCQVEHTCFGLVVALLMLCCFVDALLLLCCCFVVSHRVNFQIDDRQFDTNCSVVVHTHFLDITVYQCLPAECNNQQDRDSLEEIWEGVLENSIEADTNNNVDVEWLCGNDEQRERELTSLPG